MRNIVALKKGIVVVPDANQDNTQIAASLQAELMNLGFVLDPEAFAAACKAPRDWLVDYHNEVIEHLRKQMGASHPHRPFYVNFPAQVMEMSHVRLFINAVFHYLNDGKWEPPQELKQRGVAFENTEFKTIRLGSEEEFRGIFTKLVSINQSLTEDDKQIVAWFIDHHRDELKVPAAVPFKETLCILAAKGLDVRVTTPVDVLRIAVYMSGGDISLPGVVKLSLSADFERMLNQPGYRAYRQNYIERALEWKRAQREKFKFKKFTRGQRRLLLGLLEKTGASPADMQRHRGRWLRLGEILHSGEFALRYPKSAEAFQALRNQPPKIRTFGARVDLAFKEDWRKGMEVLSSRPGEFARRLDWMLRNFDQRHVLDVFGQVGSEVSSKVLFELFNHFRSRLKSDSPRAVMLKGKTAKIKSLPALPAMNADIVQNVGNTILRILKTRIAKLPPLGKVWIDPRLRQVPMPFAMRSVNTSVKTYVRGTRIPFRADAKVIRAFIHWYDEKGNEDLDLSAGLHDESLKVVTHISFTNLKENLLGCCHSGDIRHRQGACAEYVDIDRARCLERGLRYITVQCFNYNGRPMHTVKDCVFGLMEREHAVANEIFVPKTISNCMRLANESTSVIACVLDLKEGNTIWADLEADQGLAVIENMANKSLDVLRALVHGGKMSVYELLELHGQTRGSIVGDAGAADVALRWEEFTVDYAKVAGFMSV